MNTTTADPKKRSRWLSYSLRRFLICSVLLGVVFGMFAVQQQRQRDYFEIVQFVERSFDSNGVIPNQIASTAKPKYTTINANSWVSSVAHSPNNGPAFISSEHELIYRPSSNGNRVADVTILTSWHVFQSKPEISITIGGGEFDDVAIEYLKQKLNEHYGVEPAIAPHAG